MRSTYAVLIVVLLLVGCGKDSQNSVSNSSQRSAITDLGGVDTAYAVAIQADDKVVAAGESGSKFAVVRYNSTGTLDTKFNKGRKVITAIGTASSARATAIQSDSKIVVAGNSDGKIALARYTSGGLPDTTFNGTGKVVSIPGSSAAVAIQSDSKIVVAGSANNHFVVARYSASGALENQVPIQLFDQDECHAMALQSDGKILVAGKSRGTSTIVTQQFSCQVCTQQLVFAGYDEFGQPIYNTQDVCRAALSPFEPGAVCTNTYNTQIVTKNYFGIARLNADLSLDISFDTDGIALLEYGGVDSEAWSIALQDSKILISGIVGGSDGSDFATTRLYADGSLDTSFGNTGWAKTTAGGVDYVRAVKSNSDGSSIVMGGVAGNFAAIKYTASGLVDTTYGASGIAKVAAGDAWAGALDGYGRAIVAGSFSGNFSVKRFTAAGLLDTF
ncbi:MAG: hypothetical protein HY537_01935 [Deltaproteobacteria bacterium]|nr:hypothetical protein [Deltaproteobacteria bacterium]